jgi:drug/metabolite transporter (DMT)-like permease
MGVVEWGTLVLLSTLWGSSFFFNELALRDLLPFTLVFLRLALAAVALLVVLRLMGERLPRGPRVWRAFLAMSLLNNAVPFSLLAWGQTHVASSLASILNATTPLWAVVVAHLLTSDEKATPGKIAGVALGFAGVVVMIGGAAMEGVGQALLAQLACMTATLSYALAGVYGRQFRALGVTPMATAAGTLIAAAVVLLPAMLIVDEPWRLGAPEPIAWERSCGWPWCRRPPPTSCSSGSWRARARLTRFS